MPNKDFDYAEVYFTMGPLSIYQFAEFSKCGMGALKLFQYIKTKEGLTKKFTKTDGWCVVDNVNAYKWFGLSPSSKWRAIVKLKDPIEYLKRLEFHNSVKSYKDYFF